MAKNEMFYVDRHTDPTNPELIKADDHQLMRVYENKDDLITDIANIDDNEVAAAKGNDYEGIEVVDEVVEGNQNPVTSNATYDAIEAAKIDRVKGAFVEERTYKLWTDGRPIYRMYVESTPAYTDYGDRRTFILNIPMGTSDSYVPLSYDGYFEVVQNTGFPNLVGSKYALASSSMTPNTPNSTSMACILSADVRYQNRLDLAVSLNTTVTYGMSEQIKICAVIEYVKMSDTPVEDIGSGLASSSDNIAGIIVRPGISYSTTEVPTGDVWIDGKPIFRKTFKGIAPLTTQGATVQRSTYTLLVDETTHYNEIINQYGWVDWIRFYGTAQTDTLRMSINVTNVSNTLLAQAGCSFFIVQANGTATPNPVGTLLVYYNVIGESPNAPTMPFCFTVEYTKR